MAELTAGKAMIRVKWEQRQFTKAFQKKLKTIPRKEVPEFLMATGFAFLEGVVPKTPRLYGRAQAGWTVAARGLGFRMPAPPPPPKGADSEAAVAVAQGRVEGSFKKKRYMLMIGNGVPYIVPLEAGRSKRWPGGFTRQTLQEMAGAFRGKRRKAAVNVLKRGLAK